MKKYLFHIILAILTLKGYSQAPSVTTNAASLVLTTSTRLNGNVTSQGGSSVTGRGFVYSSTNPNPTIGNGTQRTAGSGTGSYNSTPTNLSENTLYYYKAYATNSSGTSYGSVQTFTTKIQAYNISFTNISATSLTISWTRGNLDGCLVVMSSSTIASSPSAAYSPYYADANFGSGDDIGTNEFIVYDGTGTTENITGLSPGTTYYVRVYEYTSAYLYATNLKTNNPNSISTLGAPSTQTTNISFSSITTSSITASYTRGNGEYVLVLAKEGAITTDPTDGSIYTANSVFGSGDQIDGASVVYKGTIAACNISGLVPGTNYTFKVYEFNDASSPLYNVSDDTGNPASQSTTSITQVTSITIGTVTATSIAITWSGGTGDASLVVVHQGIGSFTNPVNGVDYSPSSIFGSGDQTVAASGNYVVYEGSGNSVTITNFDPSTVYNIKVFEFTGTGTNTYYLTTDGSGANPNNATTLDAYWNGSFSSYWKDADNWNTGKVPISTSNVIIQGGTPYQPELLNNDRTVNNLTINAGASVTIQNGRTLTVNGNLLLKTPTGAGAAGQLVAHGTGTLSVSGTSTMERYYLNTNYWRYVSSPLTSPSVMDWAGFYGNSWNASTQAWNNLTGSSTISVMQGISVVDSTSDKTILFTGTFNNGNQSRSVTNTSSGDNNGWNLVGNPYPSAIDWGAGTGITRTNVAAAAYLYNSSAGTYDVCTSSPCVIAAGQGFFVHTDPSGSLAFTNDCRIASSQSFRKNGVIENPKIKLEVKNVVYTTNAFILFEPNATSEYDSEYDAFKLMSPNESIADIFTITANGTLLAINTLNEESISNLSEQGLTIPVGLTPGINGTMEISASEISNIPNSVYIYLHDKQNNTYINLRNEVYQLNIVAESKSRFEIVLLPNAVSNQEIENSYPDIFIYTYNKTTFIKSDLFAQNKGEIFVFDIMGRLLFTKRTENSNIQEINNMNTGAYIVKIIVNNIVATQKVVVE